MKKHVMFNTISFRVLIKLFMEILNVIDSNIKLERLLTLGIANYDPFKTFKYTGPLRAVYPLSPRRTVPNEIARPDYAETGVSRSEMMARGSDIKVLTPEEIEGVRKACTVSFFFREGKKN